GFAVVQAQRPHGDGPRPHGFKRLTKGLSLTPDKQAKVQPTINQPQPQIPATNREAIRKIKPAVAITASKISPLLTPKQQKKLEDNLKAHPGHMRAHSEPGDTMQN